MSPESLQSDLIRLVSTVLPPEKWNDFPVLVAVSGGADSVALLRLLLASTPPENSISSSRPQLSIAHVNHRTRSPGSDEDEAFVRHLGHTLGLKVHVEQITPPSCSPSEESLRDARYQKLYQIAAQTGARYLATGHTLDDQIETILFRFLRGTGLAGLAGIPPIRVVHEAVTIVRPLLKIRRSELESYLQTIGQPFCHDLSNRDPAYTRNYLRHQLLPQLRRRFGPTVDASIARLGQHANEAHTFILQQSHPLSDAIVSRSADQIELDCQRLTHQPLILIREWIVQLWSEQNWPRGSMNQTWWQTVAESLVSASPRLDLNLPGAIHLEKNGTTVTFSRSSHRDQTDASSPQPPN